MKYTYTITAKSCENPNITIEYAKLCEECVTECISELELAFRSVEVLCEQTGEIVYSHYVGVDWFNPLPTYGEAIDEVCDIVTCCEYENENEDDDEDSQLHFAMDI